MATYDPRVIQTFADKLYEKARSIVFQWMFMGVLLLGGLVGVLVLGGCADPSSARYTVVSVAAAIGAWIGYTIGSAKAFQLRLQAQRALCDLQIEINTRARPE